MKKFCVLMFLFAIVAGGVRAEEYPPPEKDELTLPELKAHLSENEGKVIELEINAAQSITQTDQGGYRVDCYYYNNDNFNLQASVQVSFGKEGFKFFEDFCEDCREGETWGEIDEKFYVYVKDGKLIAIGKRYRKSKNEYSW